MYFQGPARIFVLSTLVATSCRGVPAPSERSPGAVRTTSPPSTPTHPAEPTRSFEWVNALFLSGDWLSGPNLATRVRVNDVVSYLGENGREYRARVAQLTDCDAPQDCAALISDVASQVVSAHLIVPPQPWDHDDLARLGTNLAVVGAVELPTVVPHNITFHYSNALCEAATSLDGATTLVEIVSTATGTDPVLGVPELAGLEHYPRRTASLRVEGQEFHFVSLTRVEPVPGAPMMDLPQVRDTTFWVFRGQGSSAEVLFHEQAQERRSINHERTCQIPYRYPVPWMVVSVADRTEILTRRALRTIERWTIADGHLEQSLLFESLYVDF